MPKANPVGGYDVYDDDGGLCYHTTVLYSIYTASSGSFPSIMQLHHYMQHCTDVQREPTLYTIRILWGSGYTKTVMYQYIPLKMAADWLLLRLPVPLTPPPTLVNTILFRLKASAGIAPFAKGKMVQSALAAFGTQLMCYE